tara:strand:- start:483 stop:773 length:291 start_codon:yes stop_codon:yes gene_type:complete
MNKDIYQIIKAPHLTEKVTDLINKSNQYAFKVDINATKREIKRSVEDYFSVIVEEVTILRVKGKNKRSRYRFKRRPEWKKAYVRLSEGQTIDVGIE